MRNKRKVFILPIIMILLLMVGCSSVKVKSNNADINPGITFFNSGDYNNAVKFFEKVVSDGNADSACYMWMGKSLLEREHEDDMKAAIGYFMAAMNNGNDKEDILLHVRDLFFDKAERYLAQDDDYMESRCYLSYVENFDDEDVDALIRLGRIYGNTGDLRTGLYYARKAYNLDPKNKEVIDLISDINPL